MLILMQMRKTGKKLVCGFKLLQLAPRASF